ncbi:uncharacterized protein CLUP02_11248 [Colletotrichum lupini]|uniref:Uncharacterized protein n=1 Tax=Colletotrichum lupini TaxID=145971 RepID=A0A9Q8WJK3_9PEZI|nr:uncharacterized protein CLUP02_11248 [Colletotrichum lupini]UQC85749.1 hypothetical protein CLUP02_11248 [Colletotrichum lupini]
MRCRACSAIVPWAATCRFFISGLNASTHLGYVEWSTGGLDGGILMQVPIENIRRAFLRFCWYVLDSLQVDSIPSSSKFTS